VAGPGEPGYGGFRERLNGQDPERLTDLQRAARFLYLQRLAFGGKVAGRNFSVSPDRPAPFDITKLGPLLADAHERLAGVWIECLPWAEFLARWDRPHALFYLDPPYWGSEGYYGKALFSRADYAVLAGALKALRGGFIMTVNDVPQLREIFAQFSIETAEVAYTVGREGRSSRTRELIITGPGRGAADPPHDAAITNRGLLQIQVSRFPVSCVRLHRRLMPGEGRALLPAGALLCHREPALPPGTGSATGNRPAMSIDVVAPSSDNAGCQEKGRFWSSSVPSASYPRCKDRNSPPLRSVDNALSGHVSLCGRDHKGSTSEKL